MKSFGVYYKKVLNWIEHQVGTDMTYLTREGSWLVGGQIATLLFSFSLTWLFANLIPREIYGVYRFTLSLYAVTSLATLSGMSISIVHAVTSGTSGSVQNILQTKIRWGMIGSVIACGLSLYYHLAGNNQIAWLLLIVALFTPFAETFGEYQSYLQGWLDFKRQSLYRILQRVFVCVGVGSILLYTTNIYILLFAYLGIFTLGNYILYRQALKAHPPTTDKDPSSATYGFHLSGMGFLRLLSTHADKVLLFHFVGATMLAGYYFALAIPQEIISLISQVNNLALPKLTQKKDTRNKKILLKKIGLFTLLLIIPILGYIIIAPYIFQFLFPQYIDVVIYSQIFAVNIIFIPLGIITQYYYAQKNTRILYFTNIAEPIFIIGSLVVLLPLFGVIGALVAIFIKNILNSILALVLFIREPQK